MVTLTEQELFKLFEAGREQGSDEASAYDWGSVARRNAKAAFVEALGEIIHDRRVAAGDKFGTWPDDADVRQAFGLTEF